MRIRYEDAPDVKDLAEEITRRLNFSHVNLANLFFMRSKGSKSRFTIARIHGLGRVWLKALGVEAFYIIEVLSERYDPLSQEEKERILIHELLHIPKGFSGGFRHHDKITKRVIDDFHKQLRNTSK